MIHTQTLLRQMQRYVTPSLAELGELGVPPATNKDVLMVTRVPGAGSELLVLMLQRLQGYNAFKHIRLPPGDEGILNSLQQVSYLFGIGAIQRSSRQGFSLIFIIVIKTDIRTFIM